MAAVAITFRLLAICLSGEIETEMVGWRLTCDWHEIRA
jgi:hypothetical protein